MVVITLLIKLEFFISTRGEIEETSSHLEVALFRKYIIPEEFQKISEDYQRPDKSPGNMIIALFWIQINSWGREASGLNSRLVWSDQGMARYREESTETIRENSILIASIQK